MVGVLEGVLVAVLVIVGVLEGVVVKVSLGLSVSDGVISGVSVEGGITKAISVGISDSCVAVGEGAIVGVTCGTPSVSQATIMNAITIKLIIKRVLNIYP